MELTVGSIVEGKVKTITKFGAFITLPGGKTGMVHISEIAHAYVNDIHEHLTEGQDVKTMIIAIDPTGKINLSIKRTIDPPPRPARNDRPPMDRPRNDRPRFDRPRNDRPRSASPDNRSFGPKEPQSFEEKLKQFMADSDSKISSIKQYSDRKSKNKRR